MKSILNVFLLLFFFWTMPCSAQQDKEKLKTNKQKILKEIESNKKLLDETRKGKKSSLTKLVILNNQISKREELINSTNSEIQTVDAKIILNKAEINRLQNNLQSLKQEYAKMICYAYRNRNSYDRLMFVFASRDFYQAYRRLKYLQQYSQYRKKQAEMIQTMQMQLSERHKVLSSTKDEKIDLVRGQEREKVKLADEKNEQSKTFQELTKKEKKIIETLKEKEESARKLQKAINEIIAREIAKSREKVASVKPANNKPSGNKSTVETSKPVVHGELPLTPDEQLLSSSFEGNKGKLPWPSVHGIITSTFGTHDHPILPGIKTVNNGIDIATARNARVRAVFDGKVSGVISIPGSGKAIIIRHGEYLSVYSNLSEVFVKMGDKIKTKDDIGVVMTDNEESKTELHFEIWKGKVLMNPASWLTIQR